MKSSFVILMGVSFTVLLVTGCGNECRTTEGICPSGESYPVPKVAWCTWDDIVKCGGCATYTHKYGRTKCFNKATDVGESNCENECLECKVVTYKAGAMCVVFRNDEEGCRNEPCEFYLASVQEKSYQEILFGDK